MTAGKLNLVHVDELCPCPDQPRRFNWERDRADLQRLAATIKANEVLQPLIVRQISGEAQYYEIAAGERRWRAAKLAGVEYVPVIVRELTDTQLYALAMVENVQRQALTPLEEARGLKRLQGEGWTLSRISQELGYGDKSSVSHFLRLLELEPEVQALLEQGALSKGHGKVLVGVGAGMNRVRLAKLAANGEWSVRRLEQAARAEQRRPAGRPGVGKDPNILALERELSDMLAAPVALEHKSAGGGRVVISYSSLDELDGLLDRLRRA